MTSKPLVFMSIGDTGTGKSSLGNLLLGKQAFQESDLPDPCTLKTNSSSSFVDGAMRYVIDTQGLADGQNVSAVQVTELASFLKTWTIGVSAVVICLNGQYDRFSQGARDIIQFAYNAFATPDILNHICVVFTKCFGNQPNQPNRHTKTMQYRQSVQNFLKQISGSPVPEIPVFFVDTKDPNGAETRQNLNLLLGYAAGRELLDTRGFKIVPVHDKIEDQFEYKVVNGSEVQGDTKYRMLIDRKRQKITPNNGDPVRYGNWVTVKSYREYEASRSNKTERRSRAQKVKTVVHHDAHSAFGFSSHDHTHYKILRKTFTEERNVVRDFDGKTTETPWRVVSGSENTDIVEEDRERGWTDGWTRDD